MLVYPATTVLMWALVLAGSVVSAGRVLPAVLREVDQVMTLNKQVTLHAKQRGVGLIEVLIAVLILAIGLLGIAALQAVTLKNTGSASSRTQATIQIYSMLDIIRADRANVSAYNTNIYTAGDGSGQPGTMMGWLDGLKTSVAPDAMGRVICIADSMTCEVGVQWSEERATGGTDTPTEITITSQL
ncbi:type IV pilus modification protein PilV [Stenotrophomonas koreensis]|uniref:type IV pilus modification protein PilV n=1 Tax=Stenotrophomonas koreensis TaxID=266128 RepID=UPI0033965695